MKKAILTTVPLAIIFFLFAHRAPAQELRESVPVPNVLVDDDKVQCPTAQFTSIQSAINAANAGDVIRVCPGSYPEQLLITKPLTIVGDSGAVVNPSPVLQNSAGGSGDAFAAVILVQDTDSVEIRGLIVDGANNGITDCSPRLIGILYQNASGRVAHNAIRHMQLGPALNACQSGNAVEVENPSGAGANVRIASNSIDTYQKNGITGNDAGTEIIARNNVVTGIGPTAGAAQNGIQVGFGAAGTISGNTIANNIWSPCVSTDQCDTNATGILIFESNSVTVQNNSLSTNQIGVFVGGDSSVVRNNTIANAVVLIGVALVGNQNIVGDNEITRSDEAGIFVQGNNNRIRNNTFTDAAIGILKISSSTGTVLNGNHFFATLVPVVDPAPKKGLGVSPIH